MDIPRLRKRPPRFTFFLNPYTDARFTKCPTCEGKTAQKKLPLVIHVDNGGLLVLNKTCRYCAACELLIAHQDEIEAQLAFGLQRAKPAAVGNDYLVVGTVDRENWRQGMEQAMTPQDIIAVLHDFKDVVQFKLVGGWGPKDR